MLNAKNNILLLPEDWATSIAASFTQALIWQDEESLGDHADVALSYSAQTRVSRLVNVFVCMVGLDRAATAQMIEHGVQLTGHDLCLEALGHGVGFWEQESTMLLSNLVEYCLKFEAITPFTLYYDEDTMLLEADGI
jgi:hypothetical protein